MVACLNSLVGVWHHRNQQVDQHHGGHQHVEPENKLKVERVSWRAPNQAAEVFDLKQEGQVLRILGGHVHFFVTARSLQYRRQPISKVSTNLLRPKREKKSLMITWTGILQPKQRKTWHSGSSLQKLAHCTTNPHLVVKTPALAISATYLVHAATTTTTTTTASHWEERAV